jgi:hypothetical protein
MAVKAPPKVTRPAFSPSQKISAVSESVSAPAAAASSAAGPSVIDAAPPPRAQRSPFVHSS